MITNELEKGTCVFPTSPEVFPSKKINFQQAVKSVSYENLNTAVRSAFSYALDIASKKELDKLIGIFTTSKSEADKAFRLQCYLVTNFNFPTYRFSWHRDSALFESITTYLDVSDASDMVELLDAYRTSQRYLQQESRTYIEKRQELQDYVNEHPNESVRLIQKHFPDHSIDKIKSAKKGRHKFTERGEIKKIVNAKLYLLTADHKRFTFEKKDSSDPREYNALTQLSKVYRKHEFCFQLREFDIKSANAQIIDKIIGSNNYQNVYSNLMKAYNISREEAKVRFNATLNNHRLTRKAAKNIYLKAGYSPIEAEKIAKLTAREKGGFYRYMAAKETEIIAEFIRANFSSKHVFRVHDAIYYQLKRMDLNHPETSGTDFSNNTIPVAKIPLELQQDCSEVVLTGLNVKSGALKQIKEINKKPILIHDAGSFQFFDRSFLVLNSNFNINAPVYEKQLKRSPNTRDFLYRIDKLYIILLWLNKNHNTAMTVFENCIDSMLDQEGISFNKSYVMQYVKSKAYNEVDAHKFFKERDYTYKGKPLKDSVFQSLYHKARGEFKQINDNKILRRELRKLITYFENTNKLRFIEKRKFKRSRSTNTYAIIDAINSLVNVTTKRQNENYNMIASVFAHHKGSSNILRCVNSGAKKYKLAKELNINRNDLAKAISIQERKARIINSLENAITNLQHLTEVEQLFEIPVKQKPIKQPKPVAPNVSEYNKEDLQHYLMKWNQESKMVKLLYQRYHHPFMAWLHEKTNSSRYT